MAKITDEEKKWRAEADAETLARYAEIMNDSSRKNAAIKVAKERATELKKKADAMSSVAGSAKSSSSKSRTNAKKK